METQLLYEHWIRKPEWSLRAEAIPLLIGIAPEAWEALRVSGACGTQEDTLWASVREAVVTEGKPRVINPESPEEDWRCVPIDFYQWARASGVPIPEPFEALMQFIQRVVQRPAASSADALCREAIPPAKNDAPSIREKVLGAALNVLAKCPDRCYDQHGLVSGEKITRLIAAQSIRWFDTAEPPMGTGEMADLIDKWLE
ncbi:MAG: hypothetical protein ACREXY_16635 [Gammaproteobacteria bacterium]